MAPYMVMQRGYGGAKLSDFNHYAQRIIKPQRFKAILVFIANDISGGAEDRTPEEVLKLFKSLVKQIRERNPGTPVCWIETTPTPSRWHAIEQIRQANELIREYCEKNGDLHFIETHDVYIDPAGRPDSTLFRDDMLHLNREGYLLWAERIKKSLAEEGINP
jgi:lysophospholipase L1-like esterase